MCPLCTNKEKTRTWDVYIFTNKYIKFIDVAMHGVVWNSHLLLYSCKSSKEIYNQYQLIALV